MHDGRFAFAEFHENCVDAVLGVAKGLGGDAAVAVLERLFEHESIECTYDGQWE